jgi:hypothetical protein
MTSRYALVPALTAAVVFVLAIVLPFAGCGLPLQGLTGAEDAGTPCAADSQCNDSNPCTADACKGGGCEHIPQPDGPAPSAAQVAFDCQVLTCVNGLPRSEDDDDDLQADAEDCTTDGCNAGKAFHTGKPDGTHCTMGGDGICKGAACQIVCMDDAGCDDKNPCTQDSCDISKSTCTFFSLNGENTPNAVQIPGDCHVQICVNGTDTNSPDDSDLPKTATDCDEELCNRGVPSNPPRALDVACGQGGTKFCDGAGKCGECNSPTQCGVGTECLKITCLDNVCGTQPTPVNTHLAQQTPGDCHAVVCDGAGNVALDPIEDDTDPFNDNNACTADACKNGESSNTALPPGSACGNGQACNAATQCGCSIDDQCISPDTCGGGNPGTQFTCGCTKKDCAALGKTCGGSVTDACYSTQNCNNNAKDPTETDVDCGGGTTCGNTCAQGKHCSANSDCGSGFCADGVCCNAACTGTCVACSAAKKGTGVDGVCASITKGQPDDAPVCNVTSLCDGTSGCKKIDGQTCGGNGECLSAFCADGVCCNTVCNGTCLACSAAKKGSGADGVCGNISINLPDTNAMVQCTGTNSCDGNGTCKKNVGQVCANDTQCVNAMCVDGVCCGVASCPACQSCAMGANGTCGNIPAGPDNVAPNTCTGASSCDGMGNCKKSNGQSCNQTAECSTGTCTDGVCCGVATCPACQSCAVGAGGVCGPLASGMPDIVAPNVCMGTNTCDGAGNCKKVNGQTCAATAECATGTCVDGVCCGVASCPACQSCAAGGGACGNIASGMPDIVAPNVCMGTSTCDGAGNCKKVNGQTCAATAECATGTCVDNVCCGAASCPACQSCALGANGTCGNIASGMPDNVPANACKGTSTCDGGGNCKKANGQTCAATSECATGTCVDDVCCGMASCPACQSCALGANGTCGNIASGMPDNVPANACTGTSTCDGGGNCKKANGQTCAATAECATGTCVDNVCCGVASCPACQSCGASGTCGNIASGMPDNVPANACTGMTACDGMGNCKKVNGQTCADTSECATGTCVDSVCCGVASCPACQSCAEGPNGTCADIASGMPDNDPTNTCTGMTACDGVGNCKKINGQTCTLTSECVTGNCVDGVCCNVACDATASCMSCNGTTPGTCSSVTNADDADSCSISTKTCSAAGACLLKSGQLCTAANPAVCASGVCTAGSTCQ